MVQEFESNLLLKSSGNTFHGVCKDINGNISHFQVLVMDGNYIKDLPKDVFSSIQPSPQNQPP